MTGRVICIALLVVGVGVRAMDAQTPPPSPTPSPNVRVEVNAAAPHQVMEGFGATTVPLIYQNGADDKLPPDVRRLANQAVYGDVRVTLGNVEIGVFESANDNADPFRLDQSALELAGLTAIADKLVVPARALGAGAHRRRPVRRPPSSAPVRRRACPPATTAISNRGGASPPSTARP